MMAKPTGFAAVTAAALALDVARGAYLLEKGWELLPKTAAASRWRKEIPWGASSTKVVEADLLDAVRWQAQHDGDLPR